MPGLKPKADREPARPKEPRKPRLHARSRMTPTTEWSKCPDCGTHLSGGWAQRTREVIDLPQVPAQVTEHVYLARTSTVRVPKAQLDGVVTSSVWGSMSCLIAALRDQAAVSYGHRARAAPQPAPS